MRMAEDCPMGMLALAAAMSLSRNRRNEESFDVMAMAGELARHDVFHVPDALEQVRKRYLNHQHEAVMTSERASLPYFMRYPLGRSWFEVSFIELLDSDWPFFAF